MHIRLEGIAKRFRKEWIFRNVNLSFQAPHKYAIVGANGSGKSTLLQLIAGIGMATEGTVYYEFESEIKTAEEMATQFSFSAPYQELPEEFTGNELFDFHFKFREKTAPFAAKKFFELIQLVNEGDKHIKYYSSGMRQRLKLGLCVFTQAKAYFLDEPTTNLDKKGIEWYQRLLKEQLEDKLLLVSSNIEEEYKICDSIVNIYDFKTSS
jgi:ABC-type multidrug transport system ATPase subunit